MARNPKALVALHALIATLVFVGVLFLGAWQVVAALSRLDAHGIPATLADFREGRTTAALQSGVEKSLPWRDAMIATANTLRFTLTGGAGDEVRIGRDGWLFLTEELRLGRESANAMRLRIELLEETNRRLARRGIRLVVAMVPDKSRVHASHLPQHQESREHRARYGAALDALRARGVTVADLLTPLAAAARGEEVYYRTDTHWNQRGAQIAAQAIADAVRGQRIALPAARFRESVGAEVERPGDLIRLMGLEHAPRGLRPTADRERPVTIEEIAEGGGSLFGDFAIPVTLVGTSYSMRANFHGFLQEALGARVLNAARDAAGFGQSAGEYFRNEAFRTAAPQVIVWEVPERVLSADIGEEKTFIARAFAQR